MIKTNCNIRIGLDLDDTVNYWWSEYVKKFGLPKNNYEVTKNVQRKLTKDKQFWLDLPIKNTPNFEPTLYCTKRVIPKTWSKKYLEINNLPIAPIYQMYTQSGNKANLIKGRVDVFVDDSIDNMIQMNLSGVPCLLMDSNNNQDWGPIGRIYSLNKEEIVDIYNLFINTVFNDFRKLL